MVPAEDDEQCRRSGRDEDQTILRKAVWPEVSTSALLVAHLVLLCLVDTIQDREIEVGRRVVDRLVGAVRAEQRVRDERRERECERRVSSCTWSRLK